MEKLFSILALFRQGNAVANPAAWKTGAITAMALVPFLLSLDRVATAFGYPLGISQQDADAIAAGIVAITGIVSHVITSDKIGMPPKREPDVPTLGAIVPNVPERRNELLGRTDNDRH